MLKAALLRGDASLVDSGLSDRKQTPRRARSCLLLSAASKPVTCTDCLSQSRGMQRIHWAQWVRGLILAWVGRH